MGLIVDLGRWILRKACMECMKWPEGVSVAVNFSPQQFHQRDVLSEVRYALEVSGLPANRLEIEITESSLLRNTQLTHDVLSQLHSLGVRISLDDFGTGYSSLSYLHNFPLQKVKIDRSFLEGIDSDRPLTLLRGVARLSADLGMSVVVEGIETNEQLELISADGAVNRGAGLSVQPAGARGAGSPVAECLAWPPSAGQRAGSGPLTVHRLTHIPVKLRGNLGSPGNLNLSKPLQSR
jgi:EAL domain-containing protein (putative c-di-GMP-specific phosphodiesterase class I)